MLVIAGPRRVGKRMSMSLRSNSLPIPVCRAYSEKATYPHTHSLSSMLPLPSIALAGTHIAPQFVEVALYRRFGEPLKVKN
jgi:hypothetical protein